MAGSAESAQRGVLDAPPPVGHGIAAKGGDEIRPGPVFRRRRPCGIEGLDAELIGRDGEIVADFQGQVLIVGGKGGSIDTVRVGRPVRTAELYDPETVDFTVLETLLVSAVSNHAAVLLNNGQVLIAGTYNCRR